MPPLETSSVPEYIPASRFCRLIGRSRPALREWVKTGKVQPSAYVSGRALFSLGDVDRILAELHKGKYECSTD